MKRTKCHATCTLLLCLTLGACVEFPQLDDRVAEADRTAPFPDIIPLSQILTQAEAQVAPPAPRDLGARIADLNARADRLRGTVVDAATRARMRAGI